ncbi:hypothetical protein ACIGO9_28705 [Nocardia asteroides]|uniref:hypothetical protein n=1 Tax=Nocardia asteroides TaxID=1824 RepID=UPI0037CAF9B5
MDPINVPELHRADTEPIELLALFDPDLRRAIQGLADCGLLTITDDPTEGT